MITDKNAADILRAYAAKKVAILLEAMGDAAFLDVVSDTFRDRLIERECPFTAEYVRWLNVAACYAREAVLAEMESPTQASEQHG